MRHPAKNYQQAQQWYEKAAAAGDKDAPQWLKKLAKKLGQ